MTTYAEYLATGAGLVEYRVEVEGCPLQFCTTHAMAGPVIGGGAAAGLRRVGGLARDGLSFTESCYLPGADYKATLGAVVIEDTDESVAWNLRAASYVFSKIPRSVGFLLTSALAADATFSVRDSSAFTVGTVYHIDTEAFRVDSINDATTIGVTRGMWGTTQQGHFVAVSTLTGDRSIVCPIYDSPPTYRRRRVWIYGHGSSELGLGTTGTLVARGVIASAPQLSEGTTWSFGLAPLTSLMDSDVGPREGQAAFRGIYYPGASPFRVSVGRRTSADPYGAITASTTILMVGFWESNAAWCAALENELNADATIAGWGVTFSARESGSRWELFVTIGNPALYVSVINGSAADGQFLRYLYPEGSAYPEPVAVSADTEYRCDWRGHDQPDWGPMGEAVTSGSRGVPRGQYYASRAGASTPADVAAWPWYRLYLASTSGLAVDDPIRVTAPEGGLYASWEAPIAAINTDEGWVEIDPDRMAPLAWGRSGPIEPIVGDRGIWTLVTPATMPTLSLVRSYGDATHLAAFINAVTADAVANANAGVVPFLLDTDFAAYTTLEAAVLEAANGRPWLLARNYHFATAVRFSDIIKHECRLYGLFFATDTTGKITLRPLAARLDEDHVLASSDLINDDSFGEIVVEPDGILTGLTVRTGYDAIEDEHKGQVYELTMLAALSAQRARMALEIAPKTRAAGSEPDFDALWSHLQAPVSMWSKQRARVSVSVNATFHDAMIGDVVYATIPQLPYDGERGIDGGGGGIVNTRGTITGRSWDANEPAILLDIDFDALDVAGYTPTGRVTATSGAGTAWTVTLDADEYGPGGDVADAEFFVAGMKVRLMEWDATIPTIRSGTVDAVVGNNVTLTLGSSWTPGSSVWNLLFDDSTTSGLTTAQLRYAYIARSGSRVTLASGTQATRNFAP